MALTAAEQLLLELINRARLDPAAEAKRYGVDLNSGLSAGTIDTSSKQVLAPNAQLERAATDHSKWMLNADTFSHTGAGGSSPGDRMAAAGYDFSGSWTWRENLAWSGSSGAINLGQAIREHHEGLYRSAGHRANTFAENIREIGIGQVEGVFSYQGYGYNASMLTEKFAKSGGSTFITGVISRDGDGDRFYDIGEGRGSTWLRGGGDATASSAAGGYALDVGARSEVTVSIGSGGTTLGRVTLDTGQGNAKLDLLFQSGGERMLLLSQSADMRSGTHDAMLLGVEDLDLRGTGRSNDLWGNDGRNMIAGERGGDRIRGEKGADDLRGQGGDDRLWGGSANDSLSGNSGRDELYGGDGGDTLLGGDHADRLFGNGGNDRLNGGGGNDRMTGGGGEDRFIFGQGDDIVTDFTNNVDTIAISRDRVGSVAEALDRASVVNGDVVFDFAGGHSLTLEGVTNLTWLENDLVLY